MESMCRFGDMAHLVASGLEKCLVGTGSLRTGSLPPVMDVVTSLALQALPASRACTRRWSDVRECSEQ